MKCIIEINMDNAAFDDNPLELESILKKLSKGADVYLNKIDHPIMDSNGNKVGFIKFIDVLSLDLDKDERKD